LADELFKLSKGGKKIIKSNYKTTYYKVLDKDKVVHERVNYILFDSSKKSLSEINTLRDKIIVKHKDGFDFKTLAKYYSMDINGKKGGDSGWFESKVMPAKFEQEVKNHNINDIFMVDIAEDNAYYVILKSHEPKTIEEITVLKFSETRN
jgi:parvulin-like peptidyl-prolyl isomerase